MLADGIAPVAKMAATGVNVALGTDGAASNHSQDMFEVMKLTSLLQRVATGRPDVLDPYEILRMATAGGAKALGLEDKIGTIEPGKRGDVIIVNPFRSPHGVALHNIYTHLVHALKASDVETTIVDGKVLMRDRVLVGQDTHGVMAHAQGQAEDLARRILGRAG
jgi:5-methylthioadenosine/S-adenosylhomocysteine deaminase